MTGVFLESKLLNNRIATDAILCPLIGLWLGIFFLEEMRYHSIFIPWLMMRNEICSGLQSCLCYGLYLDIYWRIFHPVSSQSSLIVPLSGSGLCLSFHHLCFIWLYNGEKLPL